MKKKLTNKKSILILIGVIAVVLVGVCGLNLYADFNQMLDVTNVSATIEPNVIQDLRSDARAYVIVLTRLNEEDALQSEVLANLSSSDFDLDLTSSLGRWFSGFITPSGFNKLKNHSYISEIKSSKILGDLEIPEVNQTCLKNRQSRHPGHLMNEILISWKSNITKEEANNIVESYGLTMYRFFVDAGEVIVPEGTTLEWICILLEYESEHIDEIWPNYRTAPSGGE